MYSAAVCSKRHSAALVIFLPPEFTRRAVCPSNEHCVDTGASTCVLQLKTYWSDDWS